MVIHADGVGRGRVFLVLREKDQFIQRLQVAGDSISGKGSADKGDFRQPEIQVGGFLEEFLCLYQVHRDRAALAVAPAQKIETFRILFLGCHLIIAACLVVVPQGNPDAAGVAEPEAGVGARDSAFGRAGQGRENERLVERDDFAFLIAEGEFGQCVEVAAVGLPPEVFLGDL